MILKKLFSNLPSKLCRSSFVVESTSDNLRCSYSSFRYLTLNKSYPPSNLDRSNYLIFLRNIGSQMDNKALARQPIGDLTNNEVELNEFFDSTLKRIIEDMYDDHSEYPQLDEVKRWFERVLDYNLYNGKRNRAKALLFAFRKLSQSTDKTLFFKACLMGWQMEFMQACLLVLDDIMDDSITRRGRKCWYRNEDVGLIAVNDGLMIYTINHYLIKKYFKSSPIYTYLMELTNDTLRFTVYGQCLDVLSNPTNKPVDLTKFNQERYDTIVQFKTAYYSFCFPIRSAMYLANITDPQIHANTEKVLFKIGHFFQVQDDYLDFYGDPNVTGKIGTDIEDGKCSWLVIQALKLANPDQRTVLEQHYGIKSKESVEQIKKIYQQLNLDKVFLEYEECKFNEISQMIERFDVPEMREVFQTNLSMIYNRKK